MSNKPTNQEIAQAVQLFAKDLDNSICMEDRRDAVIYLAKRIGNVSANKVVEVFGLTDGYYKV